MRGTTVKHQFTLPFDASVIDKVKITYKQGDEVRLVRRQDNVKFSGNEVIVHLTQAESFLFDNSAPVLIQLRGKDVYGEVFKSDVICVDPGVCLDSEVL